MNCECPHCFYTFTNVDDNPQQRYRCPGCNVVLKLIQTEAGPALESIELLLEFNRKTLFLKWFRATMIAAIMGYFVTQIFRWPISSIVMMFRDDSIPLMYYYEIIFRLQIFINGCIYGCFIALAQWKVLRNIAPPFQKWFWITAGMYILTSIISASFAYGPLNLPFLGQVFISHAFLPLIPAFIHNTLLGALLGAAQWFLLRQTVKQAGWWILASAIVGASATISYCFYLYYIHFQLTYYDDMAFSIASIIEAGIRVLLGVSVLLGLAMVWLLKQPVVHYSVLENR